MKDYEIVEEIFGLFKDLKECFSLRLVCTFIFLYISLVIISLILL